MRIKLRLIGGRAAGPRDIVVTAEPSTPVGELARELGRREPSYRLDAGSPTLRVRFPGESQAAVLDARTPLGEAAIASGADVEVSGESADATLGPVRAILRVIEGPDLGAEFTLRPGTRVIGRDDSADLVLNDPLVSKRHARVDVSGRTVDIVDLNSANGVVVEGGEVPRVALESGQTVLLGGTLLRADVLLADDDADTRRRTGPVDFTRSPRVEERYPGERLDAPEVPREDDPTPFPWFVLVTPLIAGAVLFFVAQRNLSSLIFVALAPIMMIGTFVTQVLRERSRRKRAIALFERKLDRLSARLAREFETERRVRLAEAPSTEEAVAAADTLGPLLWTRRPEHWNFLNVRLGLGTAPTRTEISGGRDNNGIAEYAERLDAVIEAHRRIPAVPVVDSLLDAGALGVAGAVAPASRAANGLLAQLTGLHSPLEVSVAAIVGPTWAREFEWITWLPHTGAPNAPFEAAPLATTAATGTALVAALEELVAERSTERRIGEQDRGALRADATAMQRGADVDEGEAESDATAPTPCVVLLIGDDAPVDRARLVTLVERAANAGIVPIWVAEERAELPAVCRTYLELDATDPSRATAGFVRAGLTVDDVVLEPLGAEEATGYARRLAGVSDAGVLVADESDVPRAVSFLALLGPEMARASDAVVDRWRQNSSISDRTPGATPIPGKAGRLRALVGQAATEALHLDLRTQGPHALVGGTTGSGKSEFLQAWVLGMAAEYSPDRVTFLFVDYKGGSAFADCVDLPHCVGLVTDLTTHLVRRALTSLRAELHHREHLLNRKKAKDLLELEKRGDPDAPPALVLVIDEFAALASEVPEFVDGVVDIAQRGRSLGIHLIMATQRPAGVIKDNLRANTNLRVALRMADESDSTDVIGTPVAAGFDPAVPGRAVAKSGPGRLVTFQTGYAGGWTRDVPEAPPIEIADLVFGVERPWQEPVDAVLPAEPADPGPNNTARLVQTIVHAAAAAGIPVPRKPWLDELAPAYDLAKLRQRSDDELVLGVVDDPDRQDQRTVAFRPDVDGNLAVYGTGGSGKSTVLRELACAAGITPRGGPVQVYGLDFAAGGLRMLEALPHVGAIVAGDDAERTARLLGMLREIVDDRVERYAAVRAGSVAEYRRLASAPDEPRILVLLDGIAAFRQEYEYVGAALATQFQSLLIDGRQVGVHVVATADRPGSISPTIGSSMSRRLVLRLADDNNYAGLDVPADVLGANSPPGRGIIDDLEVQVAVLGGSANVAEQAAAIERLAATLRERGVPEAPPIRRLPERIPFSEVAGAAPGLVPLGVADDDLEPVAIEPRGAFLLTGPPSSGRSTALATFAAGLDASGAVSARYYLGGGRSELASLPGWTVSATGPDAASALAKELLALVAEPATAKRRIAVVIEAVSDFLSGPADADLQALVKAAKRNEHVVIGEGETSTWSQSWPLLMEFKSARRGFALQPEATEGDVLFKTSFPRAKRGSYPPGRGILVQAGRARRVQLALPPE